MVKSPANLFQLTAARRRLAAVSYAGYSVAIFQLTAARRRLGLADIPERIRIEFQLTAARRRLVQNMQSMPVDILFQLTAARRRLGQFCAVALCLIHISTHSRAKAAGLVKTPVDEVQYNFNSQPREGGWATMIMT